MIKPATGSSGNGLSRPALVQPVLPLSNSGSNLATGISSKATKGTSDASRAILFTGVEILGVGILAFVAGTNDEVGKVIVWIMVGLWFIWLINNPAIGETISRFMGSMNPNFASQAGAALGNLKLGK